MQSALANVDLVRVDVDDFDEELRAAGMLERTLPWFYKIDATLHPVDAISAGEWDDNVPQNMAPVSKSFLAGTLRARRDPLGKGGTPLAVRATRQRLRRLAQRDERVARVARGPRSTAWSASSLRSRGTRTSGWWGRSASRPSAASRTSMPWSSRFTSGSPTHIRARQPRARGPGERHASCR